MRVARWKQGCTLGPVCGLTLHRSRKVLASSQHDQKQEGDAQPVIPRRPMYDPTTQEAHHRHKVGHGPHQVPPSRCGWAVIHPGAWLLTETQQLFKGKEPEGLGYRQLRLCTLAGRAQWLVARLGRM